MDVIRAGDAGGASSPGAWRAPAAAGPVRARVAVPGSKSVTNRALVLAALASPRAPGGQHVPARIRNPLAARDTLLMCRALAALGVTVDDGDPACWLVWPGEPPRDAAVDVGNAGTVLRFVPPVAALTTATVHFAGDPRAADRPAGPLLAALRRLGAVISDGGRGGLPFTVHGTGGLAGGQVTLDGSASSQLVSGLLLAAPRYAAGAEIRHRGPRLPSAAHVEMTVQMLRDAGARIEAWASGPAPGRAPDTWRVQPGPVECGEVTVQPDLSNAVPFLAAAMVTGGTVTVTGWPATTAQPAGQILGVLGRMGLAWDLTGDGLTGTGTGRIRGLAADLADASEAVPVLAALAALADSPSRLTGVGHMRRHETDRLAALATELSALGGDVTEHAGGLEIRPRPLRAGGRPFATYRDHRLVMAAAVLALAVPGITVADPATVGKTFPGFAAAWASMLESVP